MRDPRADPRSGDRLRQPFIGAYKIGAMDYFHVTARDGNVVHYEFNETVGFATSVKNWQRDRATATIIHVAGG